jgi:hypothetical protein
MEFIQKLFIGIAHLMGVIIKVLSILTLHIKKYNLGLINYFLYSFNKSSNALSNNFDIGILVSLDRSFVLCNKSISKVLEYLWLLTRVSLFLFSFKISPHTLMLINVLDDMSTIHLLQYLRARYDNIKIYDIEYDVSINNLCSYIEKEAQILDLAV